MKKQRFQYGVGGYRWAPESFHVLKGLPGQKKKEVPMTREERQEVGYRFITKGFRAAVAHVKHIERARVHKKQSHITYGFRLMGERGYLCCQELSCPADAPLAMRLSLFKMIREDLKRRACQVEIFYRMRIGRRLQARQYQNKHGYSGSKPPFNGAADIRVRKGSKMSDTLQKKRPLRAVVNAGDFANALKKVSPVLKRSVIPVLEEVCVRFSSGRCRLTATDLNTWITAEIPAEGDDFSFVFSRTKDVGRVCRNFSGKITIELDKNVTGKNSHPVITMTCGSRAAEFDTYYAEDFPTTPEVKETPAFSVNAAGLLERINKVAYATERLSTEAREIRSCVQFAGKRIFALDGIRAAWDEGDMDFTQPFMVRADMLRYLKVFSTSQVDFTFSTPHLSVTDGTTTVIFRMTESEPYNLARAIPQKYVEELSVSPKEFLRELKYLSDVIPTTNKPYVYLRGTELFMSVSGKRFSTSVDIHRTSDMTVGLNLHYLTDALKQFATEKRVTVKISGVYSPVVIEAKSRSDHALILPVRVSADAAA